MSPIQVLDHYREGNSLVHRLDPRVKLVLTLSLVVAIAALPRGTWAAYLLCLVTVSTGIFLSRVPPMSVLRRSLIAAPFALAALSLVFTTRGSSVAEVHLALLSISVTVEGVIAFTSVLAKAWLSVLAVTLLVTTTTFPGLVAGIRALRVPELLVSVISFMYRYIYVIADEALRLHRAREARSAAPYKRRRGKLAWRAKVLGGMIGSLFLRSYERSERIYAAMLSRGFDGTVRSMRLKALGRKDLLAMGTFAVYLLAIVALANHQGGV
jgi:cobalt/nickel transport system permease protein